MNFTIPNIDHVSGIKQVPGDKSISHRAIMISAIAEGRSEILSCSNAADPLSTLSCIKQLGIEVGIKNDALLITGKGRHGFKKPSCSLNAGNSGTTIRLLSGLLVGQIFDTEITGDSSLSQRPMKRIIEPLSLFGADIKGSEKNTPPIRICPVPKLHSIDYALPVPSAQVKSALIFAGLYAEGTTTIKEKYKTRDHTERMLGIETEFLNSNSIIKVDPDIQIEGKKFFVPGDISAAAFLIAAGLIKIGSKILIKNVGVNPTRTRILDIFKIMGGDITLENSRIIEGEPVSDILVQYSDLKSNIELKGADVVEIIDEIPILCVTALFANGSFTIRDARELRTKETDRITALVNNLRLIGCEVEEYEDGLSFEGNQKYKGNVIPSYSDHRIAMSFGIAGLRIPDITIEEADCVNISFPYFWELVFKSR